MRFSPHPKDTRLPDSSPDTEESLSSEDVQDQTNAIPAPTESGRRESRIRVLFVCYGNACRSQMAEGFARAFHADVMEAESAGISPLGFIPEETAASMLERDVSLRGHSSKGLDAFDLRSFDVIVNMSGFPFPPSLNKTLELLTWNVDDPYMGNERRYRKVRDEIERRVARLASDLRTKGLP